MKVSVESEYKLFFVIPTIVIGKVEETDFFGISIAFGHWVVSLSFK